MATDTGQDSKTCYGSSKKRKKGTLLDQYMLLDDEREEPPLKRPKLEIDGPESVKLTTIREEGSTKKIHIQTPTRTRIAELSKLNIESPSTAATAAVTIPRTPSKTDTGFLSPSSTKSFSELTQPSPADSAYHSFTDKSPCALGWVQSVGESSGINGDSFDLTFGGDSFDLTFGGDSFDFGATTEPEPRTELPKESDRLLNFLHDNFSMLKDEMDPLGLADHLFNYGVIGNRSIENIWEEQYRAKRCDRLIKSIAWSRDVKKPCTEQKIWKAFEAENCSFLLDNLGKECCILIPDIGKFEKREIIFKLKGHMKELEDRVEPRHVIDDLVTTRMLTLLEHDDILTTDFKANRLKLLIKYLLNEPVLHFPKFCYAIEKQFPELAKKLLQKDCPQNLVSFDDNKSKYKVTADIKVHSQERLNRGKAGETSDTEQTFVKYNFAHENGKEMEQMIVDDLMEDSPIGLDLELMELGFSQDGYQFSSIRINLMKLSCLSQLRFYKKCQESPEFLERWLGSLLSQEHLKQLQAQGMSTVHFEIHIQKPTAANCACMLTKENIVAHFSHIEKAVEEVDPILQAFGDFPLFSADTRSKFKEMRSKEGRNVEFLREILKMDDIAICLLQRELLNTGQKGLLDKIVDKNAFWKCKSKKITVKSLRKCQSFLQEEIEPRKFLSALGKLPDSEEVSDFITSSAPRRERCKRFLDFIYREGQAAVDQFVQSLEAENKLHVLKVLGMVDVEDPTSEREEDRLRDSLIEKFDEVVSEVDTHLLRQVFLERKAMKAREFDTVAGKHSTHRTRITSLLKHILQTDGPNILFCFMHALETKGFEQLAADIKKEADSYKPCPRLDMGSGDVIVFKGTGHLKFSTDIETESPLQLELHKRIYGNKCLHRQSNVEQVSTSPQDLPNLRNEEEELVSTQETTRKPFGREPIDKEEFIGNWLAGVNQEVPPRCLKRKLSTDSDGFSPPAKRLLHNHNLEACSLESGIHKPGFSSMFKDTDSFFDTASSMAGFHRGDEAVDHASRRHSTMSSQSSLPTPPSSPSDERRPRSASSYRERVN